MLRSRGRRDFISAATMTPDIAPSRQTPVSWYDRASPPVSPMHQSAPSSSGPVMNRQRRDSPHRLPWRDGCQSSFTQMNVQRAARTLTKYQESRKVSNRKERRKGGRVSLRDEWSEGVKVGSTVQRNRGRRETKAYVNGGSKEAREAVDR